jgi:PhnB protein
MAIKGAREAIEFYKVAFGAEEVFALVDPSDGRIGHAEILLGGTTIMISDEYPDFGAVGPETLGGSPIKLLIYVEDADAMFAQALDLGCTEVRPMKDQFFGDRSGMLVDKFGHTWTLATKTHDVSPEEMQERWLSAMQG